MIRLELKKILKHKSIYFIFIAMFLFCFINNLLFKIDYDDDGRYKYTEDIDISKEVIRLDKELSGYNSNNDNDKNIYVSTKSLRDVYKNMLKYDKNSWQYIKYNDYMYDVIYNINYYTYVINDDIKLKEYNNKYEKYISYFKNDDYKYFIRLEKDDIEGKIKDIENNIKVSNDKELYNSLIRELNKYKRELVIVNYRLSNDISYSNTYLNRALVSYGESLEEEVIYKNRKSYNDRLKYNEIIKNKYISKYIIDNRDNYLKVNSVSNQLSSITSDYELFIIIILLISVGILFGDEFTSGTIKLLLIKPYKRSSILFSKIISIMLMLLITILFLILSELIIGGVILGFDSINNLIIYNYNLNRVVELNVFTCMFINIIARLPMFIFIILFSILINNISNNNIFSFAVSFLIFSFSIVINNLVISNNIKILKYLFTLNWNFSNYLFGGMGDFKYLSLKNSIFIYVIYVIILLVIMTINFNRKDIKNV